VDGWIAQAKQLQEDIERSKAAAHSIVQEAEDAKILQGRIYDASAKVGLLENELAFNSKLDEALRDAKRVSELLDRAQDGLIHDRVLEGLGFVDQANAVLSELESYEGNRAVGLLRHRATQIRLNVENDVSKAWDALVVVDRPQRRIQIKRQLQRKQKHAMILSIG
jgi:protein transport protein DSL1/ZW10